jgi:pyruvate,water dikinase
MPEIKIGAMIETPAAVVMIEEICKTGIQFISFGTNDLTQYTLAIDRGNDDVQYLYNELDLSVLKSISRVIRVCKKYGVETSICGQAGSNKEMVSYLVRQGIDSISVNADAASEISQLVQDLEKLSNLAEVSP